MTAIALGRLKSPEQPTRYLARQPTLIGDQDQACGRSASPLPENQVQIILGSAKCSAWYETNVVGCNVPA